jgi:hypothetical protein
MRFSGKVPTQPGSRADGKTCSQKEVTSVSVSVHIWIARGAHDPRFHAVRILTYICVHLESGLSLRLLPELDLVYIQAIQMCHAWRKM